MREPCRDGKKWLVVAAIGAALSAAGSLAAQDVPSVRPGNLELGLFAGESYGLDRFRPMGGANFAYGLTRALFPFGEVSYLPGILRQTKVATGATESNQQYSINMTDLHGGLHIRVPRAESRVVPYAIVGAGLIRSARSTATFYNTSRFGTVDAITTTVPSSVNFAVNFGGGLRFFFTQRFAMRMEFKAFKATSAPDPLDPRIFFRFAIGPVFQLR